MRWYQAQRFVLYSQSFVCLYSSRYHIQVYRIKVMFKQFRIFSRNLDVVEILRTNFWIVRLLRYIGYKVVLPKLKKYPKDEES